MTPASHAETSTHTFWQVTRIRCEIRADPERIWRLLTDAPGFPRWNSTVTSIDGAIAAGERLAIKVPLDPGRTFRPRVTRFEPGAEMEWRDGFAPMFRGVRTFSLARVGDGVTAFTMREVFSGLMLPMIRRSLPDFAPAFETYAADLKRAAEEEAR